MRISINVPEDGVKLVDEEAQKQHRTRTNMLESIVLDWLAKQEFVNAWNAAGDISTGEPEDDQ